MHSVSRRKASAQRGSPGFFLFLICTVGLLPVLQRVSLAQERRPVNSVTITGTSAIPSSTVSGWMETRPGTPFIPSDVDRIRAGYVSHGFPFIHIDSVRFLPTPDSSSVSLTITVAEGKPAFVSSLDLVGMKVLPLRDAESLLMTKPGARFIPDVLEQDIQALLKLYESSGYPFAKIDVRDVRFVESGDTVETHVSLLMEEGLLAKINQLRVEGNSTTKASVIAREARLTEGELFRGDQPQKVRQRLERMQLFSSVSVPELYVNNDGTVGLAVKVVEGNPNRFDGIVGYVPAVNSAGSGYVTGLVDVQLRNILGTGRKLAARWFRESQSSQEIDLRYREPWVASLPVNADVAFLQRKQDSTYIRNTYDIRAELMVTDELNLGVIFTSERVLPTEGYGAQVISESRTTSVGVSVAYDSRNDPVTPTSGVQYRTEYHTGVKDFENGVGQSAGSRNSTQELLFDFDYVLSFIQKQVFVLSLHGRDFHSGGVELSDLYRLGGATTLRGYRESQFLGSRIAWSNLEYRLLEGQRSYVFGFVDVGYVQTPDRPEAGLIKDELNRIGYGLGIRLDTPLGLIGVSLAFGQGDTFSTAKLHIRLANEF
jgi:outer membrane protein assembly factor BamA